MFQQINGQNIANSLKTTTIQAWRNRWNGAEWSAHIRPIISKADRSLWQEALIDLLLQQSLNGHIPNALILSYLKHIAYSQTVKLSTVISQCVPALNLDKVQCCTAVLDILSDIIATVLPSVAFTDEEAECLPQSLLMLVDACVTLINTTLGKLLSVSDAATQQQQQELLLLAERTVTVVDGVLSQPLALALLQVASKENHEVARRLADSEEGVGQSVQKLPPTLRDYCNNMAAINVSKRLVIVGRASESLVDVDHLPVDLLINCLVMMEGTLSPAGDTVAFARSLLLAEKVEGMSRSKLFCEVIRSSFLGLTESASSASEVGWAAFTFLKVPLTLLAISRTSGGCSDSTDVQTSMEQAFSLLLNQSSALFNILDNKLGCDSIQCLVNELANKHSLLRDADAKKIMTRRQAESVKLKREDQPSQQPSANLVLRADLTVPGIIKALDGEHDKNLDGIVVVMSQMMTGRSFELITSATAATGRLGLFASKLIRQNEMSRQSAGEGGKTAQTRASLFDITFIMLCHIVQEYGSKVTIDSPDVSSAFIVQWVKKCLPIDQKARVYDAVDTPDPNKIDALLTQLLPGGELRLSLTKWHEVCGQLPHVLGEVLTAWQAGFLDAADVRSLVERMCAQMCSLGVVAAAWLSSQIVLADDDLRAKMTLLLGYIAAAGTTPLLATAPVSTSGGESTTPTTPTPPPVATSSSGSGGASPSPATTPVSAGVPQSADKGQMMRTVVQKMLPVIKTGSNVTASSANISSRTGVRLFVNEMRETFSDVKKQGRLLSRHARTFHDIHSTAGPSSFTDYLVKQFSTWSNIDDLKTTLALVWGVFRVDTEGLGLALIGSHLPALLLAPPTDPDLVAMPVGDYIARLSVICLTALLRSSPATNQNADARKDSTSEPPTKIRRLSSLLSDSQSMEIDGLTEDTVSRVLATADDSKVSSLLTANLCALFRLMSRLVASEHVTSRSGFAVGLLERLAGQPDFCDTVAPLLPPSLLQAVVMMPSCRWSTDILFSLSDLSTPSNCRQAAKLIGCLARRQSRKNLPIRTRASIDQLSQAGL